MTHVSSIYPDIKLIRIANHIEKSQKHILLGKLNENMYQNEPKHCFRNFMAVDLKMSNNVEIQQQTSVTSIDRRSESNFIDTEQSHLKQSENSQTKPRVRKPASSKITLLQYQLKLYNQLFIDYFYNGYFYYDYTKTIKLKLRAIN